MSNYLFEGSDWTHEKIEKTYEAIKKIADEELHLNYYKNQLELITFEQMMDAYASVGMPFMYNHWSFGKHWILTERSYRAGLSSLAYELVINSNPCVSYLMEENTMTTQALVMAHACFGHNHFFRNNYLFKTWTNADVIIDYLKFARDYISQCEEKYGSDKVEEILDACHAIQLYGVDKYKRPPELSIEEEKKKQKERQEYIQSQVNDLWRTVPEKQVSGETEKEIFPKEPQENILHFIEENSPILEPWEREIIRIVRRVSQYFYPQIQTKIMNEGTACWVHHYIMNRLYDKDLIGEGSMMEFNKIHSNVLYQPSFQSTMQLNPYTIGFHMMKDIERICNNSTDEDKEWFPEIAGCNDAINVILDVVENYRDESFIKQFLSPKIMRDLRLFKISTDEKDPNYNVTAIHNEYGYRDIRNTLASQREYSKIVPDIQVYKADLKGDRKLELRYHTHDKKVLSKKDAAQVLEHIARLWGYNVTISTISDGSVIQSLYHKEEKGIEYPIPF